MSAVTSENVLCSYELLSPIRRYEMERRLEAQRNMTIFLSEGRHWGARGGDQGRSSIYKNIPVDRRSRIEEQRKIKWKISSQRYKRQDFDKVTLFGQFNRMDFVPILLYLEKTCLFFLPEKAISFFLFNLMFKQHLISTLLKKCSVNWTLPPLPDNGEAAYSMLGIFVCRVCLALRHRFQTVAVLAPSKLQQG